MAASLNKRAAFFKHCADLTIKSADFTIKSADFIKQFKKRIKNVKLTLSLNIFFKGTYMKKISYMGHRYNSIKLGGLRYIHPILISWCPDEK